MTDFPIMRPAPISLTADPMGSLLANSGKHLRNASAAVFEMIGGVQSYAEWAMANKTEYYTKVLPKLIPKEIVVDDRRSIDDMILELDGIAPPPRRAPEKVVDVEYENAEDYE